MNNKEIRMALQKKGMYQYELAAALGISEPTFVRWMRREMSEEKKKKIIDIINNTDIPERKFQKRQICLHIKESTYDVLKKRAQAELISVSTLAANILDESI